MSGPCGTHILGLMANRWKAAPKACRRTYPPKYYYTSAAKCVMTRWTKESIILLVRY